MLSAPARSVLALASLAGLLAAGPAHAADPDTPQGHQGRLAPYTSKPAKVSLSAEEKARLREGKPVVRSSRSETGGGGVAVHYIAAPAKTVWDVILDYDKYPERVGNVVSVDIYRREGDVLWIDMQSKILGFRNVIYSRNVVRRKQGWMSWTLDYDRTSDVQDLVGYWRVEQLASDPPVTRLDHGTTMEVSGVPDFLANYLTRTALVESTSWVKEHSEALAP